MKLKKNIISFMSVAVFVFLAAGSAKINKIHCGAFSYFNSSEEPGNGRGYVEMNDGKKIYGEEISWQTGLILKDLIKVDGEKIKIKDTRGYFKNGNYYGRIGGSYAKRIIHGKLNVYYTEGTVTVASTNSRTGVTTFRERPTCTHYVQVGDDGELNPIAGQKDIIKYVKDCPKAMEMIDKKDSQIRKAIRKNGSYLNDIFVIYNNGCR
ncbi:MAG: hypothetical protein HZB42_07385 [Sphingobacteriales bacterium]|nr:hypothetical protein [Sphingobacteriales bacterium]